MRINTGYEKAMPDREMFFRNDCQTGVRGGIVAGKVLSGAAILKAGLLEKFFKIERRWTPEKRSQKRTTFLHAYLDQRGNIGPSLQGA